MTGLPMPDVSVLDVLLHDEPIGTLTHFQGDRTLFAFNEAYVDDPDRPTLSLSFKDSLGDLITDIRPTQTRVPPFFANLLPEGAMRDYLAERAGVNPTREFFLLWVLGRDLPGALTIRPADGEAWPRGKDQPDREEQDLARRHALRFSLAGVQLKLSAVKEATGGLTIPAEGVGGSWIVKLPSTRLGGVPENEFSMMSLARRIGIDVPDVQLVAMDAIAGLPDGMGDLAGQALAVQRFDRSAEGPVHMEDFAQVFGVYPDDKYRKASYRNIAEVIGIEAGDDAAAELIRRLVFSALIGNADMHLKNWSLIYPDRRHAQLSPAYDLVSTIPYLPDDKAALTFARTKRMDGLTLDEIAYLSAKAGLPRKPMTDAAKETVARFHDVWNADRGDLPISKQLAQAIDAHVAKLPIAREA